MAKVIGALVGLIAAAVYAFGATELLKGTTGTDLAGALVARLPENLAGWLARAPIAPPEGAPGWRNAVMGIAIGAGAVGGLFLIVGSRLSAMLLWLAFLLLVGVIVGQDLALAGGYATAGSPGLIAIAGTLALTFLLAAIGNAVTAQPSDERDVAERLRAYREPLRADPAPDDRWPEPAPRRRDEPEPAPIDERDDRGLRTDDANRDEDEEAERDDARAPMKS